MVVTPPSWGVWKRSGDYYNCEYRDSITNHYLLEPSQANKRYQYLIFFHSNGSRFQLMDKELYPQCCKELTPCPFITITLAKEVAPMYPCREALRDQAIQLANAEWTNLITTLTMYLTKE